MSKQEASKLLTEYLSITAVSMLISSYLGGNLVDLLGVKNIFIISACFPTVTLVAALWLKEQKQSACQTIKIGGVKTKFKHNSKVIWERLKLPFILKPLVVILLVIIAPSVDDAMYYFCSD